jgi:hypothetical protein
MGVDSVQSKIYLLFKAITDNIICNVKRRNLTA